ncbi:MAG: DUF1853 family protein [Gallionellaceae bacterium]|nr:DUF1853 family protein [Gallionellaceae bacterium]
MQHPLNLIDSLTDPAVRDLAWVIGSPCLLEHSYPAYNNQVVDDDWCGAQFQASAAWLTALDLSPLPLHDFIAARPTHRLGHYFETLIAFWLGHLPETQLIATNLQVQQQQHTLGEYDFLFRNANGAVCHWEAAVKFYLQVEPLAEQRAFIGPGTKDRLDLKLDRIFRHQLLLGDTRAGQQALPSGLKLDKRQAYIKGYLFYHSSSLDRPTAQGISASHLSGWWVRHASEQLPQISAASRWVILPRLRWLAPARVAEDAEVMDYATLDEKLREHFSVRTEALLACELKCTKTGEWHEISRGFVVCSNWPDLNGA